MPVVGIKNQLVIENKYLTIANQEDFELDNLSDLDSLLLEYDVDIWESENDFNQESLL